jgi:putative DNA primase/helicase
VAVGEEAVTGHWEHDHTGVGNAHRFVSMHGRDIRYVPGIGWRVWDGTRWVVDVDGVAVLALARTVPAAIHAEASAHVDPKKSAKGIKWADQSASSSGLQSMVTIARSIRSVWATAAEWDAHPHLLNTPAGTVDLRSGVMREHRREDYLTQRTAVAPDFCREPYRFLRFLETSMPHAEDRLFLQRFAGYCLLGEVVEHVFVVNWGPSGRNGKSTFWEALGTALGQDYAGAAPREMLLLPPRGATKSPQDLVVLAGKRLLWASEPGSGRVVDGELVKAISGGDRLVVRRLYREPEEVLPKAKVTFLANDLRVLQTMDAAAWARAQILEWPVSFYGREDASLARDLRDEAPAILAHLIRWAVDYRANGIPAARQDAKLAARRFQTPIEAFFAERCEVGESYRVDAASMFTAFQRFVNDLGIAEADGVPTTAIAFGKLVGARFRSEASHGVRYRVGVRLRDEAAGQDYFQ